MFANQDAFYFATIRKLSIAFGSIFNNMHISRYTYSGGNGTILKTIKVPLSYATGDKWYVHATQDIPAQSATQIRVSLPRIGYELTGLQYDSERKLNTLHTVGKPDPNDVGTFLRQLNPVPYDFAFDVHIAVKNMDDGLQIIEQILPWFSPSYNLNVKDIPELNLIKDVPVIFSGISLTDQSDGSFDEARVLMWTLSFVVKGYLYPSIGDAEVIRKVIANIYQNKELTDPKNNIITVQVDPIDAAFDDDWTVKTKIYGTDEIDSNGNPIEA